MEIKQEFCSIKEEEIEEQIEPMEVNATKEDLSHRPIVEKHEEDTISENENHSIAHVRIHTKENPLICSLCGRRFTFPSALRRHMMIHTGDKPYSCSQCGKSFIQKGHFNDHMMIHTGERPFTCSLCGKRFRQKILVKYHKCIHSGLKVFRCNHCESTFFAQSSLRAHMSSVHSVEKPFVCSVCGKGFARLCKLNVHHRVHTGENQCSECGKSFTTEALLHRHSGTHREKPHTCSECGKGFTHKHNLNVHLKIHTEKRGDLHTETYPFHCSQCGQGFRSGSRLKYHQCAHTRFISFSCDQCSKTVTVVSQSGETLEDHAAGKPLCSSCGKSFSSIKSLRLNRAFMKERKVICALTVDKVLQIQLTENSGVKLNECSESGVCDQINSSK